MSLEQFKILSSVPRYGAEIQIIFHVAGKGRGHGSHMRTVAGPIARSSPVPVQTVAARTNQTADASLQGEQKMTTSYDQFRTHL